MTKAYIIVFTLLIVTLASSADRPAAAPTEIRQPAIVLSDALNWARTGDPVFRYLAIAKIQSVIQTTEHDGLLADYAAAAEIVELREYDPVTNSQFQRWLTMQTKGP